MEAEGSCAARRHFTSAYQNLEAAAFWVTSLPQDQASDSGPDFQLARE